MTPPTILIAGGGTGGHVFPAVAVAEALEALADVEVVFCGSHRGVETRIVPARGWRLERMDATPLRGGGPLRAARGALVAANSTVRALELVRSLAPRVVLSVGGYVAGPVSLAAAILGVPVGVLEPNGAPGLANRLLAPFAGRAYLAWTEAAGPFRRGAIRLYGVPLRAGFSPRPYLPSAGARLLVVGGSQGAAALNERLPESVARLAAIGAPVEVLHQAGRDRDAAVRLAYARHGVEKAAVVPFIDDMARAIAAADVVVARSGASTVAEISAVGRASVFVPFPHAADDHQRRNAEAIASLGGAVCLRQEEATTARLADEIGALLNDGARRAAMAEASRACGRPNAAADVAVDLLDFVSVPLRAKARSLKNGDRRPNARDDAGRSP